jgi:hypothetical protein
MIETSAEAETLTCHLRVSARRPHRPDITPTPASPPAPRLLSRTDQPYPHRGGSAAYDRMVAGGLAGVQGLGPMRVVDLGLRGNVAAQ